jgi:hypothetical protein
MEQHWERSPRPWSIEDSMIKCKLPPQKTLYAFKWAMMKHLSVFLMDDGGRWELKFPYHGTLDGLNLGSDVRAEEETHSRPLLVPDTSLENILDGNWTSIPF